MLALLAAGLLLAPARAASTGTAASPASPASAASAPAAASASASSAKLSIPELVDKANKALRGDSSRARVTMTITTPHWTRTMDIEGWNRGRQMAFIEILGPAKDKGNITLRRKNEMWLWMPKVERVIKIPPTMMHSSWQGSDFTYEDIVKADSIVKDYDHKLLRVVDHPDHKTYEVEADPKPDAPVVWGKVLLWIAQYGDDVVGEKEEDYSERGDLIRTIKFSDLKLLGGRRLPSRLECIPETRKGRRTILVYRSLDFDLPLPDSFFSLSRLERGGR